MKSPGSKKNTRPKKRSRKNFFDKTREENFFAPQTPIATPFFNTANIQAKLEVDKPNDPLEKEADTVADEVVAKMDQPLAKSNGQDRPILQKMESAFGADFQKVKIHTDSKADQMNRSLGAKAFAQGSDIYFKQGMYDAHSPQGKHLLAHELTHVVQQSGGKAAQPGGPGGRISQAPQNSIQRRIDNVQHAELANFLAVPTLSPGDPLSIKYLEEPSLMDDQRQTMRALVDRVLNAEAPLNTQQLIALVQRVESDPGTALIICHNITKAMARGGSPINWSNVSRYPDPLVYELNGTTYTFDPNNFHPDAFPNSSRGQESVFYAMLSFDQFGNRDEGDWYHYFALAATSYYTASGNISNNQPGDAVGDAVLQVADALRDPAVPASSAYEGWLRANAISFLEGAIYGHSQQEVNAESEVHVQGASAGIAMEGKIPRAGWAWKVPVRGSINFLTLANFQFQESTMLHSTKTNIVGDFEIKILNGTNPNHWYDTPDAFVEIPTAWYSSSIKTSTQWDTPSPVWNEVLTTIPFRRLASASLDLKDEDNLALTEDLITTFTHDLRPQGESSKIFTLRSSGSRIRVRVRAVGPVTIQ